MWQYFPVGTGILIGKGIYGQRKEVMLYDRTTIPSVVKAQADSFKHFKGGRIRSCTQTTVGDAFAIY